jgi:flagellar FliL protein
MNDAANETPEAPAAAAAPGATAGAGAPQIVVLSAVVALSLGAGAALGGFLVAPGLIRARQAAAASQLAEPHHKTAKKKSSSGKKGEAGKSPVYKVDNIIVNPADSGGQRFLMCTVAIEADDSRLLDVLREHEVELRDHVVTLLSRQPLSRLTAQGSRDSLRADLLEAVRPVLGEDGADADLRIFLPQFVVQ